jgi:trimethylamine--corrinoid protein Co-methyltransferase
VSTFAEQVHETAVALLDDPGIRMEHEDILELLRANGAQPGTGTDLVRLPRPMIREALSVCPSSVPLADRKGKVRTLTADGEPVFWSCPGLSILYRGEHRPFTRDDMAGMSRLLDQLEHVDGVFGFSLDDVPPPARDVAGLAVMARNTSKHLRVLSFSPEGADRIVAMKPVVGDHPWFSVGFTAHGPLRWTRLALEIFKRTAGHGIPTTVNGEPMAGASGPVTLAGSAAVGTAEILAGIVVNQLLEPGRPCIFNLGLAHVFDMRTAIAVTGAPENALLAKATAEMGRFYNLPSGSWVSTESMCPDEQAALEKMFGFHTHIEAGVSNIWGVGQLESELTISPAQAVIDNEMIAYARRYARGIETTRETLALELTREVGPGGHFLDTDHTREHFRQELFMPSILFRNNRETWNAQGARRLDARAEDTAAEIMARDVDNGLTDDQERELQRLAEEFEGGHA